MHVAYIRSTDEAEMYQMKPHVFINIVIARRLGILRD